MTEDFAKALITSVPKGANVHAQWERPMKVRAAYKGIPLTKKTTMVVRLVEYDSKEAVKQARMNGTLPAENAGVLGMEWVQYPYLLRGIKSGKLLIRIS